MDKLIWYDEEGRIYCRRGYEVALARLASYEATGLSPDEVTLISRLEKTPIIAKLNKCANQVQELEELYTKLHAVTGFTAEKLLEMFAAGYVLEKPDYSKLTEEMANLAEITTPNELPKRR